VPNNPDLVPILVNVFPQQLIIANTNIPFTIDALTFVNLMGEFFRVFELEFLIKSSKKILQLTTFFR
jgi:hypothetical protein